ncbi:MAG: hypothetical protein IH607_06745, partial [Firmicutes bacterium]|nr:hypothetical protein [Bacillota bacterium]
QEGCAKRGVTMILSHLNAQPESMLKKAGFLKRIGPENCCKTIAEALDRAREITHPEAAKCARAVPVCEQA